MFKVQFQSLHAVSYSNCFSKSHRWNWSLLHICNTLLIERELSIQCIIPSMVNNSILSAISEIDEKDAIICFWNVSIRKIITCKFWNKFRLQNSVNIFWKVLHWNCISLIEGTCDCVVAFVTNVLYWNM